MLTHVVLYKLKDPSPEGLAAAKSQLESLRGRIPPLLELEVGLDVIHSARSYDIALIARLEDRAGLSIYRDHPVHQPVIAYMQAAAETSIAVDFES
jgi:hypothetical protein